MPRARPQSPERDAIDTKLAKRISVFDTQGQTFLDSFLRLVWTYRLRQDQVYRSRHSYSALALAALKRLSPKDTGILRGAASGIPHRFLPRRGGPLLSFSTCKPFERTQHQTPRV